MNNLIVQAAATPPDESIRFIPLSQGKVAVVDADDFERLTQWTWCAVRHATTWYAMRSKKTGNRIHTRYMHMDVLATDGETEVDHRDCNGLNNTKANLRPATHRENCCNMRMRTDNTSGVKGVYWDKKKKKWRAQIKNDGRTLYLGIFSDKALAAKAYADAAHKYHGDFARIHA